HPRHPARTDATVPAEEDQGEAAVGDDPCGARRQLMAVAHAYFDTSVLVKRFVDESGSARARALSRRYRFLSSAIAPAEATSAVSRRRAAGDLSEPDVADILERMARERRTWELVAITSLVLSRA